MIPGDYWDQSFYTNMGLGLGTWTGHKMMTVMNLFSQTIEGADLTYLHDYLSLLCVFSFEKTFQPLSCFRSFSGSSPAESEDTSTVRPCVDF